MYVITAATRSMPNLSPPSTACHSPLHPECVPGEVPNHWHFHALVCMACQQACTFVAPSHHPASSMPFKVQHASQGFTGRAPPRLPSPRPRVWPQRASSLLAMPRLCCSQPANRAVSVWMPAAAASLPAATTTVSCVIRSCAAVLHELQMHGQQGRPQMPVPPMPTGCAASSSLVLPAQAKAVCSLQANSSSPVPSTH